MPHSIPGEPIPPELCKQTSQKKAKSVVSHLWAERMMVEGKGLQAEGGVYCGRHQGALKYHTARTSSGLCQQPSVLCRLFAVRAVMFRVNFIPRPLRSPTQLLHIMNSGCPLFGSCRQECLAKLLYNIKTKVWHSCNPITLSRSLWHDLYSLP